MISLDIVNFQNLFLDTKSNNNKKFLNVKGNSENFY